MAEYQSRESFRQQLSLALVQTLALLSPALDCRLAPPRSSLGGASHSHGDDGLAVAPVSVPASDAADAGGAEDDWSLAPLLCRSVAFFGRFFREQFAHAAAKAAQVARLDAVGRPAGADGSDAPMAAFFGRYLNADGGSAGAGAGSALAIDLDGRHSSSSVSNRRGGGDCSADGENVDCDDSDDTERDAALASTAAGRRLTVAWHSLRALYDRVDEAIRLSSASVSSSASVTLAPAIESDARAIRALEAALDEQWAAMAVCAAPMNDGAAIAGDGDQIGASPSSPVSQSSASSSTERHRFETPVAAKSQRGGLGGGGSGFGSGGGSGSGGATSHDDEFVSASKRAVEVERRRQSGGLHSPQASPQTQTLTRPDATSSPHAATGGSGGSSQGLATVTAIVSASSSTSASSLIDSSANSVRRSAAALLLATVRGATLVDHRL